VRPESSRQFLSGFTALDTSSDARFSNLALVILN
jgi:hypothetical protein